MHARARPVDYSECPPLGTAEITCNFGAPLSPHKRVQNRDDSIVNRPQNVLRTIRHFWYIGRRDCASFELLLFYLQVMHVVLGGSHLNSHERLVGLLSCTEVSVGVATTRLDSHDRECSASS